MKKKFLLTVLLLLGAVFFISCTDDTEEVLKELKNEQHFVDPQKVKPPKNG